MVPDLSLQQVASNEVKDMDGSEATQSESLQETEQSSSAQAEHDPTAPEEVTVKEKRDEDTTKDSAESVDRAWSAEALAATQELLKHISVISSRVIARIPMPSTEAATDDSTEEFRSLEGIIVQWKEVGKTNCTQ